MRHVQFNSPCWSLLQRLWTGLTLVSCSQPQSEHRNSASLDARCILALGDDTFEECTLLGSFIQGMDVRLLGIVESGPLSDFGAFGGVSGSPVYDSAGRFLGAVSEQVWLGQSPIFVMVPAAVIHEDWSHILGRLTEAPLQLHPNTALSPGDPVTVAFYWGDVIAGQTGAVTAVDGTSVFLMGHYVTDVGPCHYALLRSSHLGVVPDTPRARRVVTLEDTVGVIVYDGATGLVGVLGAEPRSTLLTLTDSKGQRIVVRVAQDPTYFKSWLLAAARAGALRLTHQDGSMRSASIRVELRGRDGSTAVRVASLSGTDLLSVLESTLGDAVAAVDAIPTEVAVSIAGLPPGGGR